MSPVHSLLSSSISFLFKKWWMSLALLGGSGHLGSGSGDDDDDLERRAGGAEHLGNDLCGGSIDAASEAVVLAQAATSTGSKQAAVYSIVWGEGSDF
jgi:hypothetical protein